MPEKYIGLPVKQRLVHIVTEWDRKQSTKRFYNPHALGLYIQSINNNVIPALDAGKSLKDALEAGFEDRLLDFLKKGLGVPVER